MREASNELAISSLGGGFTGNIALWILIFIFVLGFNKGGCGFGNIFGNTCNVETGRRCRRRRSSSSDCRNTGFRLFGGGGNWWFILIIFGIIFLLSDGIGGNTNIVNVDTETETDDD